MAKIDLNSELEETKKNASNGNKDKESNKSPKAFDLEHEKLLAELGFAADDAVKQDKDRKQKEILANLTSEKNKAMTIKVAVLAVGVIILAVILLFAFGLGKNKKNTPATAVSTGEFNGAGGEFGGSFNQGSGNGYGGGVNAPANQQGFESNPM